MKKEGRKEGRREDVSVLVDDCGGGRKGDRRGEMLPLRPRPCTAQLFPPPLLCGLIWAASSRGSFSFFVFSSAFQLYI